MGIVLAAGAAAQVVSPCHNPSIGHRSAPHHGLPEGDTPPSHPKATPGVTANSTLDHAIHKLASDDFTRLL